MSKANHKKTRCMLDYVVEAIAKLKDPHGSTVKGIVRYINCITINDLNMKNKVTVKVHKALKEGLKCGALVHQAGKYKLKLQQQESINKIELKSTAPQKNIIRKTIQKSGFNSPSHKIKGNTSCRKKQQRSKQRRENSTKRNLSQSCTKSDNGNVQFY